MSTSAPPFSRQHAPVLKIENVSKHFFDPGRGEVKAVDQVSFEASSGVLALVGANGAGKSTLLRMICTLLQADTGTITVNGFDHINDAEQVRRRIGLLSPGTKLYQRVSGRELLHYAGSFYDMSKSNIEQRIDELVEQLSMQDIIDQRCEGLSTGQSQRINIARCMIANPPVLILDEPTTGLDIEAASELVSMVQLMNDGNRLIVMSTHIISEIEELADRVVVLSHGQLAEDCARSALGHGMELKDRIRTLIREGNKSAAAAETPPSDEANSAD